MDFEARPKNIQEDLDELELLVNDQSAPNGGQSEGQKRKRKKKNKVKKEEPPQVDQRNKRHFTPLKEKMNKSL